MSTKTGLLLFCTCVLVAVALAAPSEEEGVQERDAEHWVVEVKQGLDRAKRLAEEHEVNFLGEVIPDSNLYHFSAKDQPHRKKRSLAEKLEQTLTDHPGIHLFFQ